MNTKALYNITYGLYLLTAQEEGFDNGCIINTAIQVANNPTRVSIACIKGNKTHNMIMNTGHFNISAITEKADFSLFQRFGMQSGHNINKFADFIDIARSKNGLYYLTQNSNMFLSAKVTVSMDLGSHSLFIGEVTDGDVLSADPSCTYGFYQNDIKPRPQKASKKFWSCSICGYVYEGDSIPDDYLCPLCKHDKSYFK